MENNPFLDHLSCFVMLYPLKWWFIHVFGSFLSIKMVILPWKMVIYFPSMSSISSTFWARPPGRHSGGAVRFNASPGPMLLAFCFSYLYNGVTVKSTSYIYIYTYDVYIYIYICIYIYVCIYIIWLCMYNVCNHTFYTSYIIQTSIYNNYYTIYTCTMYHVMYAYPSGVRKATDRVIHIDICI